jgi:predicted transposase YdaD
MADQHDSVFKDLIGNRDFAICFLMTYLPKELVALVDWHTVKLESANVEHIRQQQKDNQKHKEQSDLTFLSLYMTKISYRFS